MGERPLGAVTCDDMSSSLFSAARAQQAAGVPRIGVLMPLAETDPEGQARQAAFEQGLKEAAYVKDQNVAIEFRWVAAQLDRLPTLAADQRS